MNVVVKRKNPQWVASVLGNMARLQGKEIACGFPKGKAQAYPDGEQVADIAAKNCFGIGVPERDFMSYAQDGIINDTKLLLRKIVELNQQPGDHRTAIAGLMEAAGMKGANAIKVAIRDGSYRPNSPATLHPVVGGTNPKGKKSTKPLIDTGHMIGSVTHIVRER